MKINLYLLTLLFLLFVSASFGQKKVNTIFQACAGSIQKAEIRIENGSINLTTCAGKKIFINGSELVGQVLQGVTVAVSDNPIRTVSNAAAKTALTDAKKGDFVLQTDTGEGYILQALPSNIDSNWVKVSRTVFDKTSINLDQVNNTSDADKPISNAVNNKLLTKADLINGKVPIEQLPPISSSGGGTSAINNRNFEISPLESSFANLSASVTSIGTSQATLNINQPTICNNVIITNPATTLEFTNEGKIVYATGCKLTINSKITAERIQILEGFSNTNLIIKAGLSKLFPEWFGAKGDYILPNDTINPNPTDNSAPVQLLLDTTRQSSLGLFEGGTISFDAKTYYFTNTLTVNLGSIIEGVSLRGTVLRWLPNVSAIRINGALTQDGGISSYPRTADSTIVRNMTLTTSAGANTHVVNVSSNLTLTRTNGDIFFSSLNNLTTGYSEGYTVTINGMDWLIKDRISDDVVILYPYRLHVKKTIANEIGFLYPNLTATQLSTLVGGQVNFGDDNGARTITAARRDSGYNILTFGGADIAAGYEGDAAISALPISSSNAVRFNIFSGIDARINFVAENLYITEFNGHAIRADSRAYPSTQFDNQPNLNNSTVRRVYASSNHGAGFYARGVNSNNIKIDQLNTDNNAVGIFDSSFLGNHYTTIHSNSDRQGTWIGVSGSQGFNAFGSQIDFGYVESGQPSVILGNNSVWSGGDVGAGFASFYPGVPAGFLSGTHVVQGTPEVFSQTSFDNYKTVNIGTARSDASPVLTAFGINTDSFANGSSGAAFSGSGLSYFLTAPKIGSYLNGALYLQYGGYFGNNLSRTPFILTTSSQNSGIGAGRFVFGNGAFFGFVNPATGDGNFSRELNSNALGLTTNTNFSAETLQLKSVLTKPVCDVNTRKTFWFIEGAVGATDVVQICMKDAADVYSWRNFTTP